MARVTKIAGDVDELVSHARDVLGGEDTGWDRWAASWSAGDRDKLAEIKTTFACCTGFHAGVVSVAGKGDPRACRANARAAVLYAAVCLTAKKPEDTRDALAMAAGALAGLPREA